jgi:hypothetical protein
VTDLELFKDMLKRTGIDFKEEQPTGKELWATVVILEVGWKEGKVHGYYGFQTLFHFGHQGELQEIGIFE